MFEQSILHNIVAEPVRRTGQVLDVSMLSHSCLRFWPRQFIGRLQKHDEFPRDTIKFPQRGFLLSAIRFQRMGSIHKINSVIGERDFK